MHPQDPLFRNYRRMISGTRTRYEMASCNLALKTMGKQRTRANACVGWQTLIIRLMSDHLETGITQPHT
ncbi:hypothetical protein FIBSPDRAFT_151919 [Athelia psychrophila]|uniref:Uncharacterized protein n=1 Tax=Athelia psychrophila TaxID=1759441 RepID=A0A166BJA8_9AGAM|nr:hypothetical protein FIBSPDRAFT_151919 [Fibularhizoctonia sp. CBS 109695]